MTVGTKKDFSRIIPFRIKTKKLLAQFWAFFDLRPAGGFDDAAKTFRNAKSGDQPGNQKGMQSEKGPGHSRT